jgi:ATP-dependent protease ClpP protease subunit
MLSPGTANELRDIKLPWYRIRNADGAPIEPDEDDGVSTKESEAEVLIYDEIGGSLGVDAQTFVEELNDITADNIAVRINSPGGSVFDAIAIYNALVKHPANVTTYVDALAASAASVIAMAGDKCVMMVGSQMMIHDALGVEVGNAKAMREMAAFLDKQTENIASIYAAKAGGDTDAWLKLMYDETWMFAQEAVDLGLADSVYTRAVKQATKDADLEPDKPEEPIEEPNGEDGEDGEDGEEGMPDMPPTDDELIDALMRAKHRTYNRGYRYTNRRKAPAPPTVDTGWISIVDSFIGGI